MPQKLTEEQYRKELAAQKARVKAMEHLKTTGSGPGAFEDALNSRGAAAALATRKETTYSTDNTLDILRKRRITEEQSKRALLQQQDSFRSEASKSSSSSTKTPLPSGWQEVFDPKSMKTYYWNQTTNETTWKRPPPDPIQQESSSNQSDISDSDLPAGWLAVLHEATGQMYYIHQGTKEKRWTRPISTDSGSDIPDTKRKAASIVPAAAATAVTKSDTVHIDKKRKQNIDPLDPTDGRGQWNSGMSADGKMADSTASGPLWQQRPYPAPSAALKGKEPPKRVGDANIGPLGPCMNK